MLGVCTPYRNRDLVISTSEIDWSILFCSPVSGVKSLIQDCINVKVAGAYKSKVLGGIYHLFVSECNRNHLKGGGEKPISATMFDR